MGQRHQIFVKIANPIHYVFTNNATEKEALKKELGTGKFAVLTYHNGWLFGRAALQNCMNLLAFGKQFTHKEKTVKEKYGKGEYSPITPNGMEFKFDKLQKITDTIGFIMNYRPKKTDWSQAGFNDSFYIGNEGDINFDFTLGDNNDGITIIDLVENKYCFMNIDNHVPDSERVAYLPTLKPVSAHDYVEAYYPERIERINDETKNRKKHNTPLELAEFNKTYNQKALKGFSKFKVLTETEIKKIFTEMEQLKTV